MAEVLIATDADRVIDEITAAVAGPGTFVRSVRRGADVRGDVADHDTDLVVLDLQIGNMGGMATCLDLRLEAGAGRLPEVPILMLLDRRADVFLARRAGADGWLVKPLDAIRIGRATRALLAGERYEDSTGLPPAIPASTAAG
jgi:DNA-binding response OmpR family regulator